MKRITMASDVLGRALRCGSFAWFAAGCGSGTTTDDQTAGLSAGDPSSASEDSGGSGSSDDGSDTTGGPLLDIGGSGETGGSVELTCDNLDMADATSVGCEFWSTTWESDGCYANSSCSGTAYGLGIAIGNPSDEDATVTFERMSSGTLEVITVETLAPQASSLINLNDPSLLGSESVEVEPGLNPGAAFRIRSDVPITAMQIAPVGGADTFIPEASLLLPLNSLGQSHFAVGYAPVFPGDGRVAVVGTVDGTTITTSGGTFSVDAFDVHVFTMEDATGFFVSSDEKISVFSGSVLASVPLGPWSADHLQEQVVPAASWGTSYVGGRHPMRVTASNTQPEDVVWRVMSAVDDTTITLTPDVAGGAIVLAGAGDYAEFETTESFVAQSDQPFMLVQYMSGCLKVVPFPLDANDRCNEPETGDPFMIQMPPIEQWLSRIPFSTDSSYPRDFVVIMREAGVTVELSCLGVVDASHFTAIPGTSYEVGSVELDGVTGEGNCEDGAHYLTADAPVGVIVGGVDHAASYGYAGGLAFQELWTPPFIPPG
jgi:hypothetical protein